MLPNELKPEHWYWISGRGPMKYRQGTEFESMSGYSYWASAGEAVRELDHASVQSHTDTLLRIFPVTQSPLSLVSYNWIRRRCRSGVMHLPGVAGRKCKTIQDVVDEIMATSVNITAKQAKIYNVIIPELFGLLRYGTVCPLSKLIKEYDRFPSAVIRPARTHKERH